jgi:hypothetical protein
MPAGFLLSFDSVVRAITAARAASGGRCLAGAGRCATDLPQIAQPAPRSFPEMKKAPAIDAGA